jgi:UDP-N-acetylmuramoyl-tripeptide--D-alanyl-D-alanine ligase
MQSFWTLDRIAAALSVNSAAQAHSGRHLSTHLNTNTVFPRGTTPIRSISTDTRTIRPGDCFVALQGEHFDAHDFLDQAVAAGASALVVSRPPKLETFSVPVFTVDDTLVAYGDLARYWRLAWGKPIIAIAGSNGKTSTKELIRAALGAVYGVHATTANFNNRVGVPQTLLAIPPEAELAVVEVGTNLPGEIAILRDIVRPDIALITCIAEEHLEGLGDLDGVLKEESAIFDGVSLAITPANQPEVAAVAQNKAHRVISAGLDSGDLRPDSWTITPDGLGTLHFGDISISPPLRGTHNLRNTMLALAAARECGVSLEDANRGIASATQPSMRMAWQTINHATIINDAYNANPASMRAAIDILAASNAPQRVAVLGSMRELGPNAPYYHDEVAKAVVQSPADVIAGVGELADALRRVAPNDPRVITATDVDDLWPQLQPRLLPHATILLKASRGVRLERILPHITTWASA